MPKVKEPNVVMPVSRKGMNSDIQQNIVQTCVVHLSFHVADVFICFSLHGNWMQTTFDVHVHVAVV